ncbi:STAS domain-containing protein [Prauserella cavernicola]|uniref:STAS domain-containing protein n=1 Tax=Prauserella cavernicola TaxID=2800127 RepID=A0A934QXP1_9PSEU|nr:STAS domain-containing protein [Prauserella cavernicola]MBK1788418.1 STAS domain-containing protein [Prauserella cavernicola]
MDDGPNLDIRVEPRPAGLVVAHVAGDVDIIAIPPLRHCVDEQLGSASAFVLDLTDVGFFGAAGLSLLVGLSAQAGERELPWALTGGRPVLRPLEVTGLDRSLPVFAELGDAVAAVVVRLPVGAGG